MTLNRAYSTLEIKAAENNGKRQFTGIATTPTADRSGDIVEPQGAVFKLPIALLWQHNSRDPIGWIHEAKVTPKGITVLGEVASIDEDGDLKKRLDTAWQSLKAGLVRGLSIGFRSIEAARIESTYAYRYMKWEWLELSAVTVPANGDCSITAIKAADLAIRRSAFGAGRVVRLDSAPSASGNSSPGVSGGTNRRKGVVYLDA